MTTIFSQSLPSSGAANEGYSFRNFVPITGASLGQVRVTFQSGNGAWTTDHCSIAVLGSATVPNVQGPFSSSDFVELKFGGASGFALAANSTIVSDWVNLTALSTDTLCIIEDNNSIGGTGTIQYASGLSGPDHWRKAVATSYNQASVSGFTDFTGYVFGVNLIETQAIPPTGGLGLIGISSTEW